MYLFHDMEAIRLRAAAREFVRADVERNGYVDTIGKQATEIFRLNTLIAKLQHELTELRGRRRK